jgi:hypothetical protein
MTIRQDMLREKAREIQPGLERSTDIARKAAAEGRSMTRDEKSIYDAGIDAATPILSALRAARSDAAITEYAQSVFGGSATAGTKSRRLSFKGMSAGIGDKMLHGDMGQKALAPSGATVISQGFTEDPVALGRAASGLLDVLPVEVHGTSQYARLIQGTRTNLAAIVDDGDEKPASVIGLTRVEKSLKVIATLSEPGINRFWLIDNASLETFIATELEGNVTRAVETMVLTDVAGTSGIQTQAYSTSPLQTLRKCITKLEIAGHAPGAIVLHPTDWEGVELALSSTAAIEHLSLPFDPATRRLFGCPVAVTVSATAGVGHVVAQGAVVVDTDSTGISVQWSENVGDSFKFNEVICRVEGRFGTSVLAPLGVVAADLTA